MDGQLRYVCYKLSYSCVEIFLKILMYFLTLRSTASLIPDSSSAEQRVRDVLRAPSNCSSGSSRACQRVESLLACHRQDGAGGVREATGQVQIDRSIDNVAEGSASCAAGV